MAGCASVRYHRSVLHGITVSLTRWHLAFAAPPPDLTPARLRGMVLFRYRRMVCPRTRWRSDCSRCPLLSECSYGAVFAARPPAVPNLSRNRTVPRPYLFRLEPTGAFTFSLLLVGSANALFPRIRTLFDQVGRRGVIPGGTQFRVALVRAVTTVGLTGLEPGAVPPLVPLSRLVPHPRPASEVRIEFLTPASIKERGTLIRHPRPAAVISRIRDRLSALSIFWCGHEPAWDFRAIGERAATIRLEGDETRWVSAHRVSGTSGHRFPLSGFTGTARWIGVPADLWPLLTAGELVGVGKGCIFGNGHYRLTPLVP